MRVCCDIPRSIIQVTWSHRDMGTLSVLLALSTGPELKPSQIASNTEFLCFYILAWTSLSTYRGSAVDLRRLYIHVTSGIILCMGSVSGIWCYIVTSTLIGWAHAQNEPWTSLKWIFVTFFMFIQSTTDLRIFLPLRYLILQIYMASMFLLLSVMLTSQRPCHLMVYQLIP